MIRILLMASSVVDLHRMDGEARAHGLTCEMVELPTDSPDPLPGGERALLISSSRFTPVAEAFRMAGVKARE